MEEVWKSIPEFEHYMISNKGRILNTDTKKFLKPFLKKAKDRKSYQRFRVVLSKGKRFKNYHVHKLVAWLFVPNENEYESIKFLDEDFTNFDSSNLAWISPEEYKNYWRSKLKEVEPRFYGNDPKPIRATHIRTGNEIYFDSISEAVKFFDSRYNFINRVLRGIQKYHKEHYFELINQEDKRR